MDAILEKQKCLLDKAGLGFNPFKRKIFLKNKFGSSNGKSQISCFYCHKLGYIASKCYAIEKSKAPNNAWVLIRPSRTISQGPKMVRYLK